MATNIIVGVVAEKDGKILLMQEAGAKARGKWNLPAGHLDPNETLEEGATREAMEETGCHVEITGICQIANRKDKENLFLAIIFSAKVASEGGMLDPEETLATSYFTHEEILSMDDQLRNYALITGAVNNFYNNLIMSTDMLTQL